MRGKLHESLDFLLRCTNVGVDADGGGDVDGARWRALPPHDELSGVHAVERTAADLLPFREICGSNEPKRLPTPVLNGIAKCDVRRQREVGKSVARARARIVLLQPTSWSLSLFLF